MPLSSFAPAKINLYLHVTGRREDGYHTLDSLVVFANVGDTVRLEPHDGFAFELTGPLAAALVDSPLDSNLVVRAAQALAAATGNPLDVKLTLEKNLPTASGIGGGSTDAAAALRLLAQHWRLPQKDPRLTEIAATLGQDIPCCLAAETCYFCGIGNETDLGPKLPPLPALLVNPRKAVPTPAVFKARQGAFQPSARLSAAPQSIVDLANQLKDRTNGLTEAAMSLLPVIRDVQRALAATPHCLLARMSGSGATCFGLFATEAQAACAAQALQQAHPDWWVHATLLASSRGTD